MRCQRKIAETIIDKKSDHVFGLKDNQPTLHKEVLAAFDADAMAKAKHSSKDFYEAADKGHGRLEHRAVYCLRDVSWLAASGE